MSYLEFTIYRFQPTGDVDENNLEVTGSDLQCLFPTLKQTHLDHGDLNHLEMMGLACTDLHHCYIVNHNWTYSQFEKSLLHNVLPQHLFTYLDGLPKVSLFH